MNIHKLKKNVLENMKRKSMTVGIEGKFNVTGANIITHYCTINAIANLKSRSHFVDSANVREVNWQPISWTSSAACSYAYINCLVRSMIPD